MAVRPLSQGICHQGCTGVKFQLEVVKGHEAPTSLSLDAANAEAARQTATAQGWAVLQVKAAGFSPTMLGATSSRWQVLSFDRSSSSANLLVFVEQFNALLTAGLSVIESLETLQRGRGGPLAAPVLELITSLKQGESLSAAMSRQGLFPPLLVALVRSAEHTSNLPEALQRFLEHEERAAKVRHQVTSVALYPILLMLVGGAVMAFLLLYVMPRFARVFESMANLPWSAQLMVSWAKLLNRHGPLLAGIAVGLAVLMGSVLASERQRGRMLASVLSWQPLANTLRTYHLARWYRTIGMLVAGGIPLPESLDLAETVLPSPLRLGAQQAVAAMREGQPPSVAFDQAAMATPVAAQLIKAGERSGDVGDMLQRAAHFHETEITKSLDKAMRIVEPVVMTLIGLGVGIVVILMYLPIFELASAIQ